MNFFEQLKEAFVNQFTGPVTTGMIVMSLVVAFGISIFIIFVYRKTFAGIVYNRGICLTIALLTMITAMVIRTINSNLSLSLGMVGALSIIRFRTVIKEPVDTAFMFWSIAVGIMSGVGLYAVAIIGSAALGLLYYLLYVYGTKAKSQYLLVINCETSAIRQIETHVKNLPKRKLRSHSMNDKGLTEFTYEIEYDEETEEILKEIQAIPGVRSVNLVTYQNEFGV